MQIGPNPVLNTKFLEKKLNPKLVSEPASNFFQTDQSIPCCQRNEKGILKEYRNVLFLSNRDSPIFSGSIPEEQKRNSCGLYLHEGIIKMEFHSHSDLRPFNTPGIPKVEQKIRESELFFCPIIFPTDFVPIAEFLRGMISDQNWNSSVIRFWSEK
jgi:hypothetical protein